MPEFFLDPAHHGHGHGHGHGKKDFNSSTNVKRSAFLSIDAVSVGFNRAQANFENSVYTKAASGEGSFLIVFIVLFIQIFSPVRIIMVNYEHFVHECATFGSTMEWDKGIQNVFLVALVWQGIVNDIERSICGLEFASGLSSKMPYGWMVHLGILLTPMVNCASGLATAFILCDPEISIVDQCVFSFAMLDINRLDEEIGKLSDVFQIACSPYEGADPEEEDDEVGERYMENFGPWVDPFLKDDHTHLCTSDGHTHLHRVVQFFKKISWVLSVAMPLVMFLCLF